MSRLGAATPVPRPIRHIKTTAQYPGAQQVCSQCRRSPGQIQVIGILENRLRKALKNAEGPRRKEEKHEAVPYIRHSQKSESPLFFLFRSRRCSVANRIARENTSEYKLNDKNNQRHGRSRKRCASPAEPTGRQGQIAQPILPVMLCQAKAWPKKRS